MIKCFGVGGNGQLGYGDVTDRGNLVSQMGDYLPIVKLGSGEEVISIFAGETFSCAHLSNLSIKCSGSGLNGQLGGGVSEVRGDEPSEMGDYIPTINLSFDGGIVTKIACGRAHTMAISDQGFVKGWGENNDGQLGYEDTNHRGDGPNEMGDYLPYINLGSGLTATAMFLGNEHSCSLHSDNTMKCWGEADAGELGQGNVAPIGTTSDTMGNYLPPIQFPGGITITSVGVGQNHNGIISSVGVLYMWGNNAEGELGIGNTRTIGDSPNEMGDYMNVTNLGSSRSAVDVDGGSFHSCVILDNFEVKCFGENANGQLGYGDNIPRGNLANEMGDYLPYVNLGTGLTALSLHLGKEYTCIVASNNDLKCFGFNMGGELGVGHTTTIGSGSSDMGDYLVSTNLGSGFNIQLCFDFSPTFKPSQSPTTFQPTFIPTYQPTFVPTFNPSNMPTISPSYSPTNYPSFSPTSNPTISHPPTFSPSSFSKPLCSSQIGNVYHMCIVTKSMNLKCWGYNANGQLGYGDTITRGDSSNEMSDYLPLINLDGNVISVQIGSEFTCVQLSSNLEVKCFGHNSFGQLGYEDLDHRGDGPGEMGSYLSTINFGSNIIVSQLEVGGDFSLILTDSGQIKAWGRNINGNLGYGDTFNRGDDSNEMGEYLSTVDLGSSGSKPILVNAAFDCSCAIFDNNDIKCWGLNSDGVLGLEIVGDTTIGDEPNEMGDNLSTLNFPSGVVISSLHGHYKHLGGLSTLGQLFTWGRGNDGRLGGGDSTSIGDNVNEMGNYLEAVNVGSGRTTLQFQGGDKHSCALLDNYQMKCFGSGADGMTGYGDIFTRGNSASEMGDYLRYLDLGSNLNPIHIAAQFKHSCAVLNDNSMKCFGRNDEGQLGQGNTTSIGSGPNEMGDYLEPINLGTGIEIELCFDFSPTLQPSLHPSLNPSISLSPSLQPTTFIRPDCSSKISHFLTNCILTTTKQVKCWGENSFGSLGYGDIINRGNDPNEMGDFLPFVNLKSDVISTQTGQQHTCVHLINLQVQCFGRGIFGALGVGDDDNRGDFPNQMGDYLPTLNLGSNFLITNIAAGSYHTSALSRDSGRTKLWGYNTGGQLGYENTEIIGDNSSQMGDYLPLVELGTGTEIVAMKLSDGSSCALLFSQELKCWGYNTQGQLGQGNIKNLGNETFTMGSYLPSIPFQGGIIPDKIRSGWRHFALISSLGELFLWGNNDYGQLGLGHSLNIGDNSNEMGGYMTSTKLGAVRDVVEFSGGKSHSCVI